MITKFNKFDSPILIDLEDKSTEHYSFLSKYFTIPFSVEDFYSNDKINIVTARHINKLVGVSLFVINNDRIHMNYTAVDEKYRNKGINNDIKNFIIKYAKECNINLITTNVRKSNEYSLKTFLSSGFQINDKAIGKYPDGEDKIPLYLKL
jgi:ribosomal protein S18 acetylase RimI-like enzyme